MSEFDFDACKAFFACKYGLACEMDDCYSCGCWCVCQSCLSADVCLMRSSLFALDVNFNEVESNG